MRECAVAIEAGRGELPVCPECGRAALPVLVQREGYAPFRTQVRRADLGRPRSLICSEHGTENPRVGRSILPLGGTTRPARSDTAGRALRHRHRRVSLLPRPMDPLGCKNRSKGPRFKFLCEEHLEPPKKSALLYGLATDRPAAFVNVDHFFSCVIDACLPKRSRTRFDSARTPGRRPDGNATVVALLLAIPAGIALPRSACARACRRSTASDS
jgi:hypothetical protein